MQKIRVTAILMLVAIIGVTGFQAWWLKNNYNNEKQSLDLRVSSVFRNTLLKLQAVKLNITDLKFNLDSGAHTTMEVTSDTNGGLHMKTMKIRKAAPPITLVNLLQEKMKATADHDSAAIVIIEGAGDSVFQYRRTGKQPMKADSGKKIRISYTTSEENHIISDDVKRTEPLPGKKGLIRFLYNMDSVTAKDSIRLPELDSVFRYNLASEKLTVGAKVRRLDSSEKPTATEVNIGFSKPLRYDYAITGTTAYIIGRLKLPILFSLLLVGITLASFVLLYRNLMKQKRLAEVKNEFISNITHELKTPIATVGVAIEALKDFSAINDPARTREYLDISQQELQRLNLLVDKVLKLSMFENKVLEMNFTRVDLGAIVNEVLQSLRLQLEKYNATVNIETSGDLYLRGDRLHLISVIYNLIDNALKYSKSEPIIDISLRGKENKVELRVSDNGIGIPTAYQDKVFEKFFRVPHGDTHNARGYGLGLSYVAQVVKDHGGTVRLQSEEGKGTSFIIELPGSNA